MATKKTQKQWYEEIIACLSDEKQKEFLRGRIAQLEKKSASGEGKLTSTQKENVDTAKSVYGFMEKDKPYTITDLLKSCPAMVDIPSNQKAYAIVKILVADGKVVRSEDKGRAYFTKK